MTEDQKIKLITTIREKGVRVCPACNRPTIEIVGATPIPLNENFKEIRMGGNVIPCAIVGCSSCGHMWNHALIFLGFPDGL